MSRRGKRSGAGDDETADSPEEALKRAKISGLISSMLKANPRHSWKSNINNLSFAFSASQFG